MTQGKFPVEQSTIDRKQVAQKKYRDKQQGNGLVRYELQVNALSKQRFELMVESTADEFDQPWDKRQRKAKARALLFDKISQGVLHDFVSLHNQIVTLKQEVKALSPSYLKSDMTTNTPLPESIRALPDDPQQLKKILAETHRAAQTYKKEAQKHQEDSERYQKLYEVSSEYNDSLKAKLQDH